MRNTPSKTTSPEVVWLKIILATYILLCLVIAGLNYGYAQQAHPQTAKLIEWIWHFYENWIKTFFILVCSWLTFRLIRKTKRATMRKGNLIGLSITALLVHILLPLLLHNPELYLFSMPLPWNSFPLQLLIPGSLLQTGKITLWGFAGIQAVLLYHLILTAVILVGTLLYGRRWQCATLCLFNGFASEVFAPAFPLLGKSRPPKKWTLTTFAILRWVFLAIALFFTGAWVLVLTKTISIHHPVLQILDQWEVIKYLLAELLMMMFFWVAFIGRGYCYYCPLGTVVGLISKISRQTIRTTLTSCIQCGKCNQACPMTIDIAKQAKAKQPVINLQCVGCGHCVDACPTHTLQYTTRFFPGLSVHPK